MSGEHGADVTEEALHWIMRLNSGSATDNDRREFDEWRCHNAINEQAALKAEALWENFSELHFDASSNLVRPGRQRPSPSRRNLLRGLLYIGGAGALGGALWSSGTFKRAAADYVSAAGSPLTVELSDGSRLFLNGKTAVNVLFDAGGRRIELLQGQIFVEVARDPGRPFRVMIEGVSVTALGTAFDVNRNVPQALAEVAVTQHAVRVSSNNGALISTTDVAIGERLTIGLVGQLGELQKQDEAVTTAWREGTYVANGRSLDDVVAALSAWHSGLIIISSEALKKLKVNAVLDLRDPLGSLNALEAGLPIRVRHASRYFTVITGA